MLDEQGSPRVVGEGSLAPSGALTPSAFIRGNPRRSLSTRNGCAAFEWLFAQEPNAERSLVSACIAAPPSTDASARATPSSKSVASPAT